MNGLREQDDLGPGYSSALRQALGLILPVVHQPPPRTETPARTNPFPRQR
jgi:hypothetical protein